MSAVTSWIMSIFAVVIIGLIVDLLFSETRLAKFMRTATACVTVLLLVAPLPNLLNGGFTSISETAAAYEYVQDASYLSYAQSYRLALVAKGVEEQLAADGVAGATVQVSGEFEGAELSVSRVEVNLSKVVIDAKYAHIHKYELVARLVGGYLQIGEDKVVTYE